MFVYRLSMKKEPILLFSRTPYVERTDKKEKNCLILYINHYINIRGSSRGYYSELSALIMCQNVG